MISGFVNMHKIISYPLGGVNRDAVGAPKTFSAGGILRAYISSASTKRAFRCSPSFSKHNMSVRTRMLPTLICDAIADQSIHATVRDVFKNIGLDSESKSDRQKTEAEAKKASAKKAKKKAEGVEEEDDVEEVDEKESKDGTSAHCPYVSKRAVEDLIKVFSDKLDEQTTIGKVIAILAEHKPSKNGPWAGTSDDIAVIGRMFVPSKPKEGKKIWPLYDTNIEAALSVANAISTHEIEVTRDILTAVDDCAPNDGAGFKGERTLVSACMYVHGVLSLDVLRGNVGGDEARAVDLARDVVKAFALFYHLGGKNVSAPFVPTSGMLVEVSPGAPINHCNAFDTPVIGTPIRGIIESTIDRFGWFVDADGAVFDAPMHRTWYSYGGSYPLRAKGREVADQSCDDPNTMADIVAEVISGRTPLRANSQRKAS